MTEPFYQLLDRIEAEPEIEMDADASSLDFLQAVYRDPTQPLSTRMKAAIAALPFEHPKLAVTTNHVSIALLMETEMARQGRPAVIDARPLAPEILEPRR
jgi:hypothetical protein